MLTFTICTLLILFIFSLNVCEGDFFLSLQIAAILAFAVFIISLMFIFYFIIFSALILYINQGVMENADIAASILSTIATAIYTSIGLKQLNGN